MQEPDEAYILKIGLEIMSRKSNGGPLKQQTAGFERFLGAV
jgi:hypothetical protein